MAKESIFINLQMELLRAKVTTAELAGMIEISPGSMSSKFTGKTEFNLDEMERIKEKLESFTGEKYSLDYLFKR